MAVKVEKLKEGKPAGGSAGSGKDRGISFIAEQAKKELKALTNLEPSTIVGASREGQEWVIILEMIEKRSIPDGMDILGTYEVHLDAGGRILNFSRISLRKRADTTE